MTGRKSFGDRPLSVKHHARRGLGTRASVLYHCPYDNHVSSGREGFITSEKCLICYDKDMTNPETANPSNDRVVTLPQDTTIDQLLERLVAGNIPVGDYGTGNAKTVLHLLSEISEGEATLTIDNGNNVFREVNVLWSDVLCEHSDGTVYLLKEDRQEFKDGRVKRRNLESSIGEKLKPSESPEEAVGRALQEELGISDATGIYRIGYDERTFIPDTFPGIESTYKMHKYVTVIPESEFQPQGYIEYQADKTNYYVWTQLHPATSE